MTRKTRQILASLVLALSLAAIGLAQAPTRWHDSKVNNEFINQRWAQLAEEYKADLPLPKVAIFDIGYPRTTDEFEKLDGYGVVLVSALSETRDELPIARVFVTLDGKDTDLQQMHSVLTTGAGIANVVTKGPGGYRMDALYAFPVWLRSQQAELKLEFAKDKRAMVLARFGGPVSPLVKALPTRKPNGTSYPAAPLEQYMKREYPGYFESGLDGE